MKRSYISMGMAAAVMMLGSSFGPMASGNAQERPSPPAPGQDGASKGERRGGDTTREIARPPIGERPSPAEALRAGDATETRQRPPEGAASGGIPDAPMKR